MVSLINFIVYSVDNLKQVMNIFIKLSKAFHSVDFKIMLNKVEHIVVIGLPLFLINTCMSDGLIDQQ